MSKSVRLSIKNERIAAVEGRQAAVEKILSTQLGILFEVMKKMNEQQAILNQQQELFFDALKAVDTKISRPIWKRIGKAKK